jgi:hypothetical protein
LLLAALLTLCIFEWRQDNVSQLAKAKRAELALEHLTGLSNDEVLQHISKKELDLHCRR